ncbi:folate-binding protein YgfZ [Sphingomonas sp. AP4-R1]|uniref:CAF17-like 4Fe-4S cluster assembly/insertion protein YgfZ n=1 Tax=Sphingomonas sp. AP4-R1 TaxID=2735134 RepID=UPI00149394E5|nr:folate-binding protein YgfZ [Sphingomonas sp. AP4-R1]QJU56620.1 folate-binding protein YgfZ [Sphingomonas sp. AP4-R1]
MTMTFLADRALIRLSGEDVRGFLQGLVTSDVAGTLPVWAGLLTAQGKALFDFLVWADGDDLLIDCEADQADALARRLTLYRLRRKIEIARDLALGVHWSATEGQGVPDPRLPELGWRWIGPAGEGPGAESLWRAHRLGLGVAEGVAEIGSDKTLWLETNATELGGVSFTKGCYVGQENTARMNWRQKVNRRLVVRRLEADPGESARIFHPDLGLAVVQMRVADIAGDPQAILPRWLQDALADAAAHKES